MRTSVTPPPESIYRYLDAEKTEDAVSVIVKLRGETCDIDCLYCYEKRKEKPGGLSISEDAIEQLGRLFRDRPLAVELHGGEPLTLQRARMADVLDSLAAQPNIVRVTIQTNGVRLDNEWIDLFDAHYPSLYIGVSLDGDALGNSWRVDYKGRPTYERTAAALELLGRRGRKAGVICVVTPRVLGRAAQIVDSFRQFTAVNAVSLVPCFDLHVSRPTAQITSRDLGSRTLQADAITPGARAEWATEPAQYADFVLEAAARWIETSSFGQFKLEPVFSVMQKLHGLRSGSCHFNAQKCHHIFTLYPDGRFGSCDELPWPAAQLTTLSPATTERAVVAKQHSLPLLSRTAATAGKCATCDYHSTCGGGCAATRIRIADALGSDDLYCAHRMRMIDGVAAMVAAPLDRHGRTCTTIRWLPVEPNVMPDTERFLSVWNDPQAARTPARLQHSDVGNINTVGEPGVREADDLDPLHPQWRAAIEGEVWPLVDLLTSRLGFVTYDSCAGHIAHAGNPAVPLRVGLLPRTATESSAIARHLCRAARKSAGLVPENLFVQVTRANLTSAASGRLYPVINLSIGPRDGCAWPEYFRSLPSAVRTLTVLLEQDVPDEYLCTGSAW